MEESERSLTSIQELVQLTNLGVSPVDVTWSRVSMTSDKHICICCNSNDNQSDNLMVLDLGNVNHCYSFLPYTAESAMVNPATGPANTHQIALKVGDTLFVMALLAGGAEKRYTCMMKDLQFWSWLSPDTLGIVTDYAVLNWTLAEGSMPQKVFSRHDRLDYTELTCYKADTSLQWLALTGLLPQDNSIEGVVQLYSVEKDLTQCIVAHAVTFLEYRFEENQTNSTLMCVATRETATHGKVDIIELEPPSLEGNIPPSHHSETIKFYEDGRKYDFPIALQGSAELGLLYVLTKYGHLHVCDLQTALCLASVVISTHVVFASTLNTTTQGILALNTCAQVLAVDIKMERLIDRVETVLKKPATAERLRKVRPIIPVIDLM